MKSDFMIISIDFIIFLNLSNPLVPTHVCYQYNLHRKLTLLEFEFKILLLNKIILPLIDRMGIII